MSGLVEVVRDAEDTISKPGGGRMESDGVLAQLAGGLAALDYTVEKGKKKVDKIDSPVLFGNEGASAVTMEVDAFRRPRDRRRG